MPGWIEGEVEMHRDIDEVMRDHQIWREEMESWRLTHRRALAALARIENEVREQQYALAQHAIAIDSHELENQRQERVLDAQSLTPELAKREELTLDHRDLKKHHAAASDSHRVLRDRHTDLMAELDVLEGMQGVGEAAGWRDLQARDLMTPQVIAVDEDLKLPQAAAFLIDQEISGAVVADGQGQPVGVLSTTDITLAICGPDSEGPPALEADFFGRSGDRDLAEDWLPEIPEPASELRVREVMHPEIYTVPEETPVCEVARQMLVEHIHRLLVTRGNELVGIISSSDMLGLFVDSRTPGRG